MTDIVNFIQSSYAATKTVVSGADTYAVKYATVTHADSGVWRGHNTHEAPYAHSFVWFLNRYALFGDPR